MPWFSFSRRRAEKLAAARRAVRGADTTPATPLERDFDALWRDLDQLQEASFPAREQARSRWHTASHGGPARMLLATAALLLVMGVAIPLGLSLYREHVPQIQTHYATAADQQQFLTLPDGSTMRLNIDTRAQVRYFYGRREILLESGEAFFSVVRDQVRPFDVIAGALRVRVLGTQFNVRLRDDGVDVAVREGQVSAYGINDDLHVLATLSAGQQASFSSQGLSGAIARIAPDAAGAWTEGWIKLDRAPLAQLIEELGRYRTTRIDLAPDAAGLRVSGAFHIDDLRGVLQMLPRVLPVTVTASAGGGYLIKANAATGQSTQVPQYLETPLPR